MASQPKVTAPEAQPVIRRRRQRVATQPKVASPEAAGIVLKLSVADIDPCMDSRIGLFWPEKAEALSARIVADGQNDPIKVRRNGNRAKHPWSLVCGLHRLKACESAGISVNAIEVEGDEADLQAIQASENADRRELEPLERAMFVAAVVEAAKARMLALHSGKSQQQVAAEIGAIERKAKLAQRSADRVDRLPFSGVERADAEAEAAEFDLAGAYRWSEQAAAACGLSLSDLKRSLRIYRVLIEGNRGLIDQIKHHPIAQNASALLAIAAKCANDRDLTPRVLKWLIEHPDATTADQVLAALHDMSSSGGAREAITASKDLSGFKSRGGAEAPEQRRFNAAFRHVSAMERREFAGFLLSPLVLDRLPKRLRDVLSTVNADELEDGE